MNHQEKQTQKEPSTTLHKTLTIVGIVLCVILVPLLIINCTLIVKSFVKKDEVPSIFGVVPLIVLTDSMYPEIHSGDIIICNQADPETVEVGDVISFYDPAGNGTSIVTHRVEAVNHGDDGKLTFSTKGDNNNTPDRLPVPAENLVGIWSEARFPGAGNVALFMQTTAGLIVCVFVPLVLLVGYDLLRRKLYDKKKGDDVAALKAELEALRKTQNAESGMQNEEVDTAQNTESEAKADDEKQSD